MALLYNCIFILKKYGKLDKKFISFHWNNDIEACRFSHYKWEDVSTDALAGSGNGLQWGRNHWHWKHWQRRAQVSHRLLSIDRHRGRAMSQVRWNGYLTTHHVVADLMNTIPWAIGQWSVQWDRMLNHGAWRNGPIQVYILDVVDMTLVLERRDDRPLMLPIRQ